MNEKTYERVKIPTEVHVVFERRLIVGTYTDLGDATRRASARSEFGAIRKTYVAEDRNGQLLDALHKLRELLPAESPAYAVVAQAIGKDATFEWTND